MPNPKAPTPKVVGRSLALWVTAGLVVLVAVGVGLVLWLRPESPPPAGPPAGEKDEDLEELVAVVNPGYVGIEVCAECHADRAAEFKTTRHYLACTTAEGVNSPGFTPERGRFDTDIPGLRYEMSRSGNDFFATTVQKTAGGEKRDVYQIGLVYGSGNQRDESYFAWRDDSLYHIPVGWLYPQGCWGALSNPLKPTVRPASCLECHNTWIEPVPGSANRYRRENMFLSVTCERCHGPGREHVEHHRQNPGGRARAILHPGTLSRERLMDLCAQCHANTRILSRPFSYRPGQPLDECYRTVRARYREDDASTNQVRYLGESKCYQKSQLTCVNCHNPHRPTSARNACAQCHAADECKDRLRQPAAVRDNCVDCHMPQHIWMNSHYYTTATDKYLPVAPRSEHRIGVYPRARDAVIRDWLRAQTDPKSRDEADRMAARLAREWLDDAGQMRRAYRYRAAIGAYREANRLVPNGKVRDQMQEVIKLQSEVDDLIEKLAADDRHLPDETIRLLKRILELSPDNARIHSELGTLYATTGRADEAIPHLKAVERCDPCNSAGLTGLAWLEDVSGRPAEATELCARADQIEPGQPVNYFVWGMALLKQRQWTAAESRFRQTLRSNPTHAGANKGLGYALLQQGQAAEAVRHLRRAVWFGDPNDAEAALALADAFAAAGRPADARKTLEMALAFVERHDPALAASIRRRLRDLQRRRLRTSFPVPSRKV